MHDKSRLLKSTRLESWKKADFNEERKRIETDVERTWSNEPRCAARKRDRLEGTYPETGCRTSQRTLKTIFSRIMMSSDVFGVGRDKSRQVDTDRRDNFNAFVPSSSR